MGEANSFTSGKKKQQNNYIHQAEWLHQNLLKWKLQINIQSHKKQSVCDISAELN